LQNEFFGAGRFGGNRVLIGRERGPNRTSALAIAQVSRPSGNWQLGFSLIASNVVK
jgi:hypothetical protein